MLAILRQFGGSGGITSRDNGTSVVAVIPLNRQVKEAV
jgi:hypothetical protein